MEITAGPGSRREQPLLHTCSARRLRGGSSAPGAAARAAGPVNGLPEPPAAARSHPPLPTPSPAVRAGPARLRRELRPPHASAHRGNSAPAQRAKSRGLPPSPLFKPLPAVSASLAPTRSLRPAELTGGGPAPPHVHTATRRPPPRPPARPRRAAHWFSYLPFNVRAYSIGWRRCLSQCAPPRAPPLPFPDTSGVLKRPFEVTSKIYF